MYVLLTLHLTALLKMPTTVGVYWLQCGLPTRHPSSGGVPPLAFFQARLQRHQFSCVSSMCPPPGAATPS